MSINRLTKIQLINAVKELINLGQNNDRNAERIIKLVSFGTEDARLTLMRCAEHEWMYNQGYIREQENKIFNNIKIEHRRLA